jgi:hypothetical protein
VLTSVEASALYFVASEAAVEIATLAVDTCAKVAVDPFAVLTSVLAAPSADVYAEASAAAVDAAAL